MKIIIVGSGIAGLSTYLFLRKYLVRDAPDEYEVYIYESHVSRQNATDHHGNATVESLSESTAVVGGGLGVSPNGMNILRDLDPAIHDAVVAQGFPCENFTFKAARNNWTLFTVPTNDKRFGPEYCVASSRHGLHECLKAKVPEGKIIYKRVSSVDMNGQGQSVIHFADGSEDDVADLVIGADGIKSAVKKSMFGAENDTSLAPKFDDLIGVGGFVKAPIPEELQRDKSMVFTFGPTAFFGYSPHGPLSSNQVMWWSNYELSGPPSETRVDPADIKEQLKKRHGKWPDPLIGQIIAKCDVDTIWPIWITPELPNWSEGGRILIGDAAHALNPTSGQGASQALEDAKTLSLLLAHLLPKASQGGNIQDKVKQAGKLFYEIRNPRVMQIQRTARKSKAMKKEVGVVLEFMMYFMLLIIGKFPSIGKLVIGDTHKILYSWDAEAEVQKKLRDAGEL